MYDLGYETMFGKGCPITAPCIFKNSETNKRPLEGAGIWFIDVHWISCDFHWFSEVPLLVPALPLWTIAVTVRHGQPGPPRRIPRIRIRIGSACHGCHGEGRAATSITKRGCGGYGFCTVVMVADFELGCNMTRDWRRILNHLNIMLWWFSSGPFGSHESGASVQYPDENCCKGSWLSKVWFLGCSEKAKFAASSRSEAVKKSL